MHRHGYKGAKFHRERDQREALIEGLADSLIKYESIETTLIKAKAVGPYVEKLITKAKKGDLHNRRQIIASLQTIESAHKLIDEITPKLGARNSGYFRIERTRVRRGDNAQLARVSFVDDLTVAAPKTTKVEAPKPKPAAKPAAKKPAAKKVEAK
jgi:large subunit ribosomal protein L17